MKSAATWAVFGALLFLVPAASSAADAIVRKTGTRVAGKITGSTKTDLTIKPATSEAVSVPVNEIVSVDWDDATAEMKLAASDENNGKFDAALQRLNKSKADTKTDLAALQAEFDFLIARVNARMALADPGKRDAALQLLTAFQKANGDHFRYFEAAGWLAQVQLAKEDFAAAQQAYEILAQAPFPDLKLAAKIGAGRILMGQQKYDEAVRSFDEAVAAAGNSPAETSKRQEAQLGKARALIAENKQSEALDVLTEIIAKMTKDADPSVQAEARLLRGNALQALSRPKEAVLEYLWVDVIFSRETRFHPEALFHMSRLWKAIQFPERGLEAQAKLESAYPNSEWTKKLAAAPAE